MQGADEKKEPATNRVYLFLMVYKYKYVRLDEISFRKRQVPVLNINSYVCENIIDSTSKSGHLKRHHHGENQLPTTCHNSATTWVLTLIQSVNVIIMITRISLKPYLSTNSQN